MKTLLLFSAFEFCVILAGFFRRPFSDIQWMSREYTGTLKGISMMTVLWSHVGQICGVQHIQFISGVGLSLFIMFSGYGLQLSVEKNGLENFWKRRFTGVILPYWLAETVGLLASGIFTWERYLTSCFFIRPAIGPEWFMQFIMISYLIFYLACLIVERKDASKTDRLKIRLLCSSFLIWFIVDGLFFAQPAMPFLKARQMICFPIGIAFAKNRDYFEKKLSHPAVVFIGGFIGLLFMGITQLKAVKTAPFLIQNCLSLFTVFPLALAVLTVTNRRKWLLNNSALKWTGEISFELYLIHMFTLQILNNTPLSLVEFTAVTIAGAWLYHIILQKGRQKWLT